MKIKKNKKFSINNSSGFLAADFLFSFVLVISCGIIIFALTFSLATVEIAQYIVWSSARAYSAANKTPEDSKKAGQKKFNLLAARYPSLTGVGSSGAPWFELTGYVVGDNASDGLATAAEQKNALGTENRHPWTGARADLFLKLFSSLKIPFLGKISTDDSVFKFPIRAFILRNPSQQECLDFYSKENRFEKGIKSLETWSGSGLGVSGSYVPIEDNGC
jgi:hypothetical protein